MAEYSRIADMVISWANSNTDVLPYSRVKECLEFSADTIYHELRIPPFERVHTYSDFTSEGQRLTLPSDFVEAIELRELRSQNNRGGQNYYVFEEYLDTRSFNDQYIDKNAARYFTREGDDLVIYPGYDDTTTIELYYYRRLPDVDARYAVNRANQTQNLLYFGSTRAALETAVRDGESDQDVFIKDPDLSNQVVNVTTVTNTTPNSTGFYLGRIAPNWLRDQNRKALLFGAVSYAHDYLEDTEMAQVYRTKLVEEIELLKREENMRRASGGNVVQKFDNRLI